MDTAVDSVPGEKGHKFWHNNWHKQKADAAKCDRVDADAFDCMGILVKVIL